MEQSKKPLETKPDKEIVPYFELTEKSSDDLDTIRKAIAGDKDAFSVLFLKTYRRMYYAVRKILKKDEDIYDALQIGYTKAYKYISGLSSAEMFIPWLRKTIENAARDVYSDICAHKTVPYEEYEEDSSASDKLDDSTRRIYIREVLSDMDPRQAEVLTLYFYDGMKLSEIAKLLDEPPSTVRSRFHAAKKRLVKLLKVKGIDSSMYGGSISAMIAVSLRSIIGTDILSAATAQQMLDEILDDKHRNLSAAAYVVLEKQRNKAILKAVSWLMALTVTVSCITAAVLFTLKDSGNIFNKNTKPVFDITKLLDIPVSNPNLSVSQSGGNSISDKTPPQNFHPSHPNTIFPSMPGLPDGNIDLVFPPEIGGETSPSQPEKPDSGNTPSDPGSTNDENNTSPPEEPEEKPEDKPTPPEESEPVKDPFVPDYRPGKANTFTRSPNNISAYGIMDQQDEWIYFIRRNNYALEKVRKDGTGNTVLYEPTENILSLNVIGDWIYYAEVNCGIYRIRTDGTRRERLAAGSCLSSVYYFDNNIYYAVRDDSNVKGSIYRYNINSGKKERLLTDINIYCVFYMTKDYILYYSNGYFYSYSLSERKGWRICSAEYLWAKRILIDGEYAYWAAPEGIMSVNYTVQNTRPGCIYKGAEIRLDFVDAGGGILGFSKNRGYLYLLNTETLECRKTQIYSLENKIQPHGGVESGYQTFEPGWVWGITPSGSCAKLCYTGTGYQEYS